MIQLELTLQEVDLLILALLYALHKNPYWNEQARKSLNEMKERLVELSLG